MKKVIFILGKMKIVETLVKNKAKVDKLTTDGESSLYVAAKNGN